MKSHNREKNIKIAILLNVSFTVIELIGGILTNSLAIMSDALHDFGDSIALITAWYAEKKAKKSPDNKKTFGYGRLSLFSALFSAIVLFAGSLFILSVAIPRLLNPAHVNAPGMIGLAVVGIFFNSIGFLRLKKGKTVNESVLSWHLLEDVLGWVVILIGGIIIQFWDNHIIDPIMTVGFSGFVLWGISKNIKETFNIFMEGVPSSINIDDIKNIVLTIPGVNKIHDVHLWSLDGENNIITVHVVVLDELLRKPNKAKKTIRDKLKKAGIAHSTIELESSDYCSGSDCLSN